MEKPTARISIALVILINTGWKLKDVNTFLKDDQLTFLISCTFVEFGKLLSLFLTFSRPPVITVSLIFWDLSFKSFISSSVTTSLISCAKKSIIIPAIP